MRQPPPLPRSEERAALAAAILRRDYLLQEVAVTKRALEELRERRRANDPQRPVELARAAVETAKENAAAYLVASIRGEVRDPPLSVKDAGAALQAAEDELETQSTVLSSLEAKLAADNESLKYAHDTVKRRIEKVIAAEPSFEALFVQYESLQRQMAEQGHLLSFLFSCTPHHLQGWQNTMTHRSGGLQDKTGPWRAALAALEDDPDAPLPTSEHP